MAGLEVRNGRYNVIVRFGGQRFVRSLKTGNEKEALTKKLRIEETLKLIESGRVDVPADCDFMTFLMSDGKLAKKPKIETPLTIAELFNRFFDALPEGHLEGSTHNLMKIHRRHLERELGVRTATHNLGQVDIQNYVNKRAKKKTKRGTLSANTIRKEVATFKSVWNWAVEAGHLRVPFPAVKLRYPKTEEAEPFQTWAEIELKVEKGVEDTLWDCLYLSMEEVAELLKHVKSIETLPCIYPMFCLAAYTGARRSELLRAQLADVDLESSIITIREKKRVRGKSSSRRVPIAPPLKIALATWIDQHPGGTSLFTYDQVISRSHFKRFEPTPLRLDQASHYFEWILRGSKWKVIKGWHTLRHSFISNCASRGVDQRMIDEWVGHTTESMRRRYRHLFPNSQQVAIQKLLG